MTEDRHPHEPTMDELQQEEPPERPLCPTPVNVEGPVRVQELPTHLGGLRTITIDTTGGTAPVLKADPRRKQVTLLAHDQDIRLGTSQQGAVGSTGALWPVSVPLVLQTGDELWIVSTTGTTELTVIVEQWTQ